MKIDILTLFPNMFTGPFDESIINRARDYGLVDIQIHQLRDWAKDKHKTVDDRPYGGGVGMLMKVEVIYEALEDLRKLDSSLSGVSNQLSDDQISDSQISDNLRPDKLRSENRQLKPEKPKTEKVVLLDAGGEKFTQKKAVEYSKLEHLILVCGRYEGVDYRVHEHLVDDVISIGDFVVTGGELPAMLVTDAVTRLIPNVLEKDTATDLESFSLSQSTTHNLQPTTLLEYPQYTRPEEFNGWKVPEILLTGDHDKIEKWRKEKSLEKTQKVRPDLLK